MIGDDANLAALELLETVAETTEPHIVRHFIYVDGKSAAGDLVLELRAQKFEVFESASAASDKRLVLAIHTIVPGDEEMGAARALPEQLAEQHGAEYDGWEIEIPT